MWSGAIHEFYWRKSVNDGQVTRSLPVSKDEDTIFAKLFRDLLSTVAV